MPFRANPERKGIFCGPQSLSQNVNDDA